jgi:circadian clock protein KaiC
MDDAAAPSRNPPRDLTPLRNLSTGIAGLDLVLGGGLAPHRIYLIEGEPGTGKTTTGLQFLLEGVRLGETVVYITLAETAEELQAVAQSHGWSIDGIQLHEVLPSEDLLGEEQQYTMFHPSEVEMANTVRLILSAIEKHKPTRVVLDSLSELQLLADSPLRYRRQVLALKQFFSSRQCTVMLLDDRTAASPDLQVRSIAHAVIQFDIAVKDYGAERRRVRLIKYRGRNGVGGLHDYAIQHGGLVVFPRLVASDTREVRANKQIKSGLNTLDLLLGGGVEEGTSTLIVGPPGTGKSSLAAQFLSAHLQRGGRAAMFLFEESTNNLLNRADGLGMKLRDFVKDGSLVIQQIDPAELTPGQFSGAITKVAADGAGVVVIDSLNGYMNAVPDERFLTTHMHEVLTYLGQRGVATFLVGIQQGMLGGAMSSALEASYLADNVVMLRYFEEDGEVRQAISVFKKRGSRHERTIREFAVGDGGIHVGPVLKGYRGILTGVPVTLTKIANEEASSGAAGAMSGAR